VEVVASLSQGRTAAAQCGLFTQKSVPVIFESPCTFVIIRGSVLLKMINISDKVVEKIKPYIQFNFFSRKSCLLYEIVWKHTVEPDRPLGKNMTRAYCVLDN